MSDPRAKHWMQRGALTLGFGGAVLLLLAAIVADRGFGQDVLIIAPSDPTTIELNRAMFVSGDSVAELYGNPLSQPVRVILPSAASIVRPAEDPSLVLLKVDKQKGENPLQAQTVWLFAKLVVPALTLFGLVGLFLRRRGWHAARVARAAHATHEARAL